MHAIKIFNLLIFMLLILEVSCLNLNNSDHLTSLNLPKFICNVIKSAKREDSGLKTVAFVTTENQLEHSMIDDVMRCRPMEISTTLIDLSRVEDKMDVKVQLVVLMADQIDGSSHGMSSLLSTNHMSKFLIITSDPEKLNLQSVQKLLNSNGIQNFAIIAAENDSVAVQRPEIFNGEVKVVQKLEKSQLSRQLFPDKLKNLNGYKYKVAIDFSTYPITSRNNRIVQRTSHLFQAIAKSQNGNSRIISVKDEGILKQQKFDFIIDAQLSLQRHSKSLNLYNRNNFCIMLPKVRKSDKESDEYVKIALLLTYVILFLVWRLYENRGAIESAGNLMIKVFAAYNGQNLQTKRENRPILLILMQLLMIMAIFSNIINQWSLGNMLAYSQNELDMKVTQNMFALRLDTKILVDSILDQIMPRFMKKYQLVKAMDRLDLYDEDEFDHSSFDGQKMAMIGQCDFLKVLATPDLHVYVYPISSVLSSMQVNFGPQNPLTEKIEKLISFAFEAGLTEIWETKIKMKIFRQHFGKSEGKVEKNVIVTLNFQKLWPLFEVLLQGFYAAFVVLLIEIFYHGCIRHLSWQLIRYWTSRTTEHQNWQNVGMIRRAWYFWRQRRNLRVRRVNVRSMDV